MITDGADGSRASRNDRLRALLNELTGDACGPYDFEASSDLWGRGSGKERRHRRVLEAEGWSIGADGRYWPGPGDAGGSAPGTDDAWVAAARIFPAGYVGGWSAAAHWSLSLPAVPELLVLTPGRPTRHRVRFGAVVIVAQRGPAPIIGIAAVERAGSIVAISDPARTIADMLDAPSRAGGIESAASSIVRYWASPHRDDERLLDCLGALGNGAAYKRLGYLVEILGLEGSGIVGVCRRRMSNSLSLLDPGARTWGPEITRWRLRVNGPEVSS